MGLFVYFAVPLICTLLFRTIIRQPAASLFLEGLHVFLSQSSAIPAPPPGARTTKRDRKFLQKRQLALQGAQSSVVLQQLSTSALSHLSSEPSTFAANFETLGILLFVLFVGVVVHFTLGPLIGLWQDVLLYTLGPLVVVWAATQLLLLEAGGSLWRLLGPGRMRVLALGLAGAAGAYALLVAAPPGWLRWDVGAAAKQLDALVNGGMTRLVAARMRHHPGLQPPPPLAATGHQVAVGLALLAGLIAASLLAAAARIARLYSYMSPVPHWAEKYLKPNGAAYGAVRLALALPLVVVLYGIRPMVDYWELPPATVAAAGPALVAAAALALLFAVRPLAGAHLGSGLLEWHLLKHEQLTGVAAGGGAGGSAGSGAASGGGAASAANGVKEVVMRKRLQFVYATVGQVGLQLLAPAAMLTCLALLYGGASGSLDSFRPPAPLLADLGGNPGPLVLPPLVPGPVDTPNPASHGGVQLEGLEGLTGAEAVVTAAATVGNSSGGGVQLPPLPPLDFVATASGFLSWWTCLVLCLFTYPLMFVYRAGMHVG